VTGLVPPEHIMSAMSDDRSAPPTVVGVTTLVPGRSTRQRKVPMLKLLTRMPSLIMVFLLGLAPDLEAQAFKVAVRATESTGGLFESE